MNNIAIEKIHYEELMASLRKQAEDTFPSLKDESRQVLLSKKWITNAEFCTYRDKEGHLAGMIVFYANNLQDGIIFLPHVYVSPFCRGKGVFSELLKKICSYGSDHGFKRIRLEVESNNNVAVCSYRRTGFHQISPISASRILMEKMI